MKNCLLFLLLLTASGLSAQSADAFSASIDSDGTLIVPAAEQKGAEIYELRAVQGCDMEVFLTFNTIPEGFYQAVETVVATGNVASGLVTMQAGDSVTLDPEFQVSDGAELEVRIDDCVL